MGYMEDFKLLLGWKRDLLALRAVAILRLDEVGIEKSNRDIAQIDERISDLLERGSK